MSEFEQQKQAKVTALLTLLSTKPSNEDLVNFCESWNVQPEYYCGTMRVNRAKTEAKLCKYVLSL